jgi:hypothetical protein
MKQLDKFPNTSPGRPSGYDWDTILDGNVYEMKRGEDFARKTNANSVRTYLVTAARKKGYRVRSSVRDKDTIVIQTTGRRI